MTRLIQLVLGVLLLATPACVKASYVPYRLFEMVGGAEVIITGEVASLNELTCVLKIDRVVAGSHEAATIEVRKFQDWSCSWRYAGYEVGQRVVAFLERDEHLSRENRRFIFRLMGAGCEAETPAVGDFVYLSDFSPDPLRQVSLGRHLSLVKFPLNELISAIEGYRLLYRVTLDLQRGDQLYLTTRLERVSPAPAGASSPFRSRQRPITPLALLQKYSQQSILHWYLVDSSEAAAQHLGIGSVGWRVRENDAWSPLSENRFRGKSEASKE